MASQAVFKDLKKEKIKEESAILTYMNTEDELVDVLAKPTSATVNDRRYPLWGLIPRNGYIDAKDRGRSVPRQKLRIQGPRPKMDSRHKFDGALSQELSHIAAVQTTCIRLYRLYSGNGWLVLSLVSPTRC